MSNKEILLAANAAVSRGDNEGFLAYCSQDVSWTFVGDKDLKGKQAVRQYMKEVYVQPPQFDVLNLIEEGQYVTAVGKISLQDESGNMINYEYCDVWRLEDGKLTELKAFVIKI